MKASQGLLLAAFVLIVSFFMFILVGIAFAQGISVTCGDGYCMIREADIRAMVERLIYLEKHKGVCI